MDKIVVRGGKRLAGEVEVAGSKNAALPILFATLLTDRECVVRNIPDVADVRTAVRLLRDLGAEVEQDGADVSIRARDLSSSEASYDLVKTMRASFLVLGPLLARVGKARVSQPGGCAIGARPVNLHLNALQQLGAEVELVHGYAEARAGRLSGAHVQLDFPSVGATEHLMMVACLADGDTEIENAAREPEIVDLAAALTSMGALIEGAGEAVVRIRGAKSLGGMSHTVLPDRIEAGTFAIAAAMTGGDVKVVGARADCLQAVIVKLREAGATVEELDGALRVSATSRLDGADIKTQPYPGFPTDLQAQMMALATVSSGTSVITETIFENRFMHAVEFMRLGADISLDGHNAVVRGVERLSGAEVMASDLRASVSLILAGLVADNATQILRVYHLDRGYQRIEEKLAQLGADIERVKGARG
jgi:UDP-N-acetylglucosamine 1-carboxyvinyltransferase